MESGEETPQKVQPVVLRNSLSAQKVHHPRTPSKGAGEGSVTSFHFFSTTAIGTPPAKRFQRVRNPFEAALAERLHLPIIGSPSLFQRPVTPQLSSTQFEWTIDEVSSLLPAHVEPHETQFHDSPDPEYEAKAQSAISSYFKEQQIVPSPVDCPLRNHRIILSELNGNTPISKPGRRIRDIGTQTALTFPAVLPKALEDALRPYFQPHLADEGQTLNSEYLLPSCRNESEAKDTSLRRKLFDMHNIVLIDNEHKTPTSKEVLTRSVARTNSSPLSVTAVQRKVLAGNLSDSDKSSMGSLSPISPMSVSISIHSLPESHTKRKTAMETFLQGMDDMEQLSPIHPPTRTHRKLIKSTNNAAASTNYRVSVNTSEQTFGNLSLPWDKSDKFTPDGSSSPFGCLEAAEPTTDNSFDFRISRLVVNSSKRAQSTRSKETLSEDIGKLNETEEMVEGEEDDMQVSQMSVHSCSSSSGNQDTPRGKRRTASPKNLSQSFSCKWLDLEQEEEQKQCEVTSFLISTKLGPKLTEEGSSHDVNKLQEPRVNFYRTDSGFNEMTCSSSLALQSDDNSREATSNMKMSSDIVHFSMIASQQNVSMVCCSTPSKNNPAY